MSVLEGKTWCEWCQDYTLHTDEDCDPCGERIAAGEAARAQASELARLRAELAEMREHRDGYADEARHHKAGCDVLRAELAEVKVNAERYRTVLNEAFNKETDALAAGRE